MTHALSRRQWLAGAAAVALAPFQEAYVIVVLPPVSDAMRQGIELGTSESRRMAELLGRRLDVIDKQSPDPGGIVGAIAQAPPEGQSGYPLVALQPSKTDAAGPCAFLLAASEARRRAALAQWSEKQDRPDTSRLSVAEWHPTLKRFGASELNERFQLKFRQPMTSEGWLGWAAVKALAEAAMRRGDAAGSPCDDFARLRFDGHKGSPLRFDPQTRELRQPLYIVERSAEGERLLGEVTP